jgi:hypothetical protein
MKEQSKIIVHDYKGFGIPQRQNDAYVNVSLLCKANQKQFKHWNSTKSSKLYLKELSCSVGIPTRELIVVGKGGQGTWAHKLVAMEIAKWISPSFAVWCNQHLLELMETGKTSIEPSTSTSSELGLTFNEYLDYLVANREIFSKDKGLAKITLERILNIL